MSKPWITEPRDRLSAKYLAIHAQLRAELKSKQFYLVKPAAAWGGFTITSSSFSSELEPLKQARKAAKARDYRQRGGE